ncbi:MAG: ABC transporter permease [Nanoarchaeota archaeon]|nr:ABC transporter permease [Nanoarchaeota archaeon]
MKLYRINALLLKYYYMSINRLDRIFDIVFWPVIDIFIWGFVSFYIYQLSSDVNILNMIMGGIMMWTLFWRAQQDFSVYILEDFWSRNLFNLFASPLKDSEFIISTVIFGFFRALLTFIFLGLLSYFMYSFNILSVNLLGIAVFGFSLMIAGWAMGIFVASLIFRFGMRVQAFAWSAVWLIQPFSAVFYPVSALPNWAQKIAYILPTSYIFEGMRQLLSGGPINWNYFFISIAINLVALYLAILFFKSCLRHARKNGMLVHPE